MSNDELLDALARLAGAFSGVVRGNAPDYKGDPTNCYAYWEALAILGRDLETAHPRAKILVRDFQRAADDVQGEWGVWCIHANTKVSGWLTFAGSGNEKLRWPSEAGAREVATDPQSPYKLHMTDGWMYEARKL